MHVLDENLGAVWLESNAIIVVVYIAILDDDVGRSKCVPTVRVGCGIRPIRNCGHVQTVISDIL